MSSLTYYPQRQINDCLVAGLECLLQRPREDLGELAFYEGGYLSYASVGKILKVQPRSYAPILPVFVPYVWRESIPMLLGIAMPGRAPGGPLHCVYWDGYWAWEPWTQTFLVEDMRQMKIAYAIICLDQTTRNREVGTLDWFSWMDEGAKRAQTPEATKECAKAEELGLREWLSVVG